MDSYRHMTEKMMSSKWRVIRFAIPSAKQSIMESTPSLAVNLSQFAPHLPRRPRRSGGGGLSSFDRHVGQREYIRWASRINRTIVRRYLFSEC